MSTNNLPNQEVARPLRRIRALAAELAELQQRESGGGECREKERRLDQLRWQLANVVRRTVTADLGNAA